MSVNNDIPDISIFGRGSGDFRLPSGYVDEDGKVFNRIYLREMTGVEDDIMDDDELNVSDRITSVLTNCTLKLTSESGDVVEDRDVIKQAIDDTLDSDGLPLTIPDRMAGLLYLRRLSLGDVYKFDRECPHCDSMNKGKQIDLRELQINFSKDPTKRRVKLPLHKSGRTATLKVLSASGERRIAEMRPGMKDVKSAAILARLEALDDKPLSGNNEADLQMVKSLPVADRRRIINTFNVMEGSIETEVEVTCQKMACKKNWKFDLDLGQVFFSPQDQGVSEDDLVWI